MANDARPGRPPSLEFSCGNGCGMCVSLAHRLIIVSTNVQSDDDIRMGLWACFRALEVYSLSNGALIRRIVGRACLIWEVARGGLCLCSDGGSVLYPDCEEHELQVVGILGETHPWGRRLGVGLLSYPRYVDCNSEIIVVSEYSRRITILSWSDGRVLGRCGDVGVGFPCGVRLLGDGNTIVVAWAHRLCVFRTTGQFVEQIGRLEGPYKLLYDVIVQHNEFVVAPTGVDAMSDALGSGGLVFRRKGQVQVFYGLDVRRAWIAACAVCDWRGASATLLTSRHLP